MKTRMKQIHVHPYLLWHYPQESKRGNSPDVQHGINRQTQCAHPYNGTLVILKNEGSSDHATT